MEPISRAANLKIQWIKPKLTEPEYELTSDIGLLGTVKFSTFWDNHATVETAEGCWLLKPDESWIIRVIKCRGKKETSVASFYNYNLFGGGKLELRNGLTYGMSTNFWQTRLDWVNYRGDLILRYLCSSLFRRSDLIQFEPADSFLPDLPLIVMLSWYQLIMKVRRENDFADSIRAM